MSLWRSILRWFGLHREARVQITAPGIEVTLAGDPTQVRALMGVIRTELERKARRDRRNKRNEGQIVRPTELDEMDSPYALPEAVVMPVPEDERSDDRGARLVAMSVGEPDTIKRSGIQDLSHTTDPSLPATAPVAGAQSFDLQEVLAPSPPDFGPEDVESVTKLSPRPSEGAHPGEGPTPPVAKGVRAASPTEVDTLEVDRRLKRVTRPLYPTLKASEDTSEPA